MRWLLLYNLPQGHHYICHVKFWKKRCTKKDLHRRWSSLQSLWIRLIHLLTSYKSDGHSVHVLHETARAPPLAAHVLLFLTPNQKHIIFQWIQAPLLSHTGGLVPQNCLHLMHSNLVFQAISKVLTAEWWGGAENWNGRSKFNNSKPTD